MSCRRLALSTTSDKAAFITNCAGALLNPMMDAVPDRRRFGRSGYSAFGADDPFKQDEVEGMRAVHRVVPFTCRTPSVNRQLSFLAGLR